MPQTLVGRYELTTLLGRGGMGQVWEAVDRQLDRKVAVKLLTDDQLTARQDHAELVRRFMRESTLTAGLQHPGVPTVHDAGSYDGGLYLVLELVEGRTIADIIADQGALPPAWTAAVGAQICAVLAAAHERGLVHRDIKPRNLMIGKDGAVKVLDFGVASVLDAAGTSRITRTGVAIGTLAYMAPEQLRGEKSTPSTDLYALGCVLYEMLAGRQVFEGPSAPSVIYKHLEAQPEPLARNDLPHGLEWLVNRLLAKDPAQRPGGPREVYEHLLTFMRDLGPLGDMGPSGPDPTGKQLYARVVAGVYASGGGRPGVPGLPGVPPGPTPPGPYGSHSSWASAPGAMRPTTMPPGPMTHQSGPAFGGPTPSGPGHFAHHLQPQFQAPRRGFGWKLMHSLWVLPSLFFGFFTWLGFLYIAVRHSSRTWLITGLVYIALAAVLCGILVMIPDEASPLNGVGAILLVLMWFGGIAHCLYANVERLRRRSMLGLAAANPAPLPTGAPHWPGQPQPMAGGQPRHPYGY